MNIVIAKLKQYWPEIVLIAGAVWSVVGTQVQTAVGSHPELSAVLAALVAIGARALPSSVSGK